VVSWQFLAAWEANGYLYSAGMRAVEQVHVEWVEQEAVVLDPRTGRVHYLNPQAALFYALILEHGYEAAVDTLHERFGGETGLDSQLSDLVSEMVEKGLLVDD
jgi:hypothetical protein